jgi:hypothetical protein
MVAQRVEQGHPAVQLKSPRDAVDLDCYIDIHIVMVHLAAHP